MPGDHPSHSKDDPTPLPKLQISIILLMRLAEPVSFSIIFPFISQMVEEELGVVKDKSQVGFYAGLIESIFSLAQALLILRWARLSDRIGRRIVILIGLSGVAVSNLFFGFSKSLIWAIASRAIMGALNGNVAVVSSLISELTDKTNRALAFSLYSGTWGIAFTLGSLLGGYLSKPVENFPALFGKRSLFYFHGLFERYPYSLPCLTASFITSLSFLLGLFFLKETHPSILKAKEAKKLQKLEAGEMRSEGRTQAQGSQETSHSFNETSRNLDLDTSSISDTPPNKEDKQSSLSLLKNPHIRVVMISNSYLSISQVCSDAALVLFLYTPIELGGLGLKSKQIGIYLASIGLTSALLQLLLFPSLQKRFGTKKVFAFAMSLWVSMAALLPICNWIARRGLINNGGVDFDEIVSKEARTIIYILLSLSGLSKVISGLSFACNTILVNESAKLLSTTSTNSSENLGALNGLAVTIGSIMRCIGPALTSSLYAVSVSKQLIGGQLVWWLLVLVGIMGVRNCLLIRDLEKEEDAEDMERERVERDSEIEDENTPLLGRTDPS